MSLEKKVNFQTKLYVWSILLEPMLFFVLMSQEVSGIALNISRILQFFVLARLFIFITGFSKSTYAYFNITSPLSPVLRKYTYYLIYLLIVSILGLLMGRYNFHEVVIEHKSFMSAINLMQYRPMWEFVILGFQFFYFIILAPYFLKSDLSIRYFFRMFSVLFFTNLLVGWIDFILVGGFNFDLVIRHIADFGSPGGNVGFRFHGFCGEPRDAFVYLLAAMLIFSIKSQYESSGVRNIKYLNLLIILTMIMTQSMSGIIGIIIGSILVIIFTFSRMSQKQILRQLFLLIGISLLIIVNINYSDRLGIYANQFQHILNLFENDNSFMPYEVMVQFNNIYPVIVLYREVINYNFFPILFGSGIGSVGSVLFETDLWEGFVNPNSQIIRLIYENGLIGLSLYIFSVMRIYLYTTTWIAKERLTSMLWIFLFLLGSYLAHRSSLLLICLGLLLAVSKLKKIQNNEI
jgi:hypothetical protein